jgi:hypothetical protein
LPFSAPYQRPAGPSKGSRFSTYRLVQILGATSDNRYKHFKLDSSPYSFGEISSLTGEGVSAWEVHDDKGLVATCLIYEYTNGSRRYTRGCSKM